MSKPGSASAAPRSVVHSTMSCARPIAARRSPSRPTRSSRGMTRSWPTTRPPSRQIGTRAFCRCWVEQMRPVAPLTMMPIVLLGMRNVIRYCPLESRSKNMPRHIVCLTFDFDTQSGFIARGMTSPTPLSRGEFGLTGAQRILGLLKSHRMRSTWFIPGFTIESHPQACAAVVEDGHEVAHHSWAHVPPASQSRQEEEADLVRANAAIERLTGRKARGYLYDSSLMGADYWPYAARLGDRAELGKPFVAGEETRLIEMPISWSLDDFPHFEFVRTAATVLPGLQSARAVMQNWLDEFLYMKKTVDWGVLTYTMHPYVIGRGYRMLAFEDLVEKLTAEGAIFLTMEDAAREAQARMEKDS